MEKTIEKLREVERDVLSHKARAITNSAIQEYNRALRYLSDARTCLRVIGAIHMPPKK
jgi:hypothetical protein